MDKVELQRHIADLLPARVNEDIAEFAYLEGGYSNRNYAFTLGDERLVLRLPERTQPFVDRAHEQSFIARLPQALGPTCLALDAASGRMISRWVEGVLLVDVADTLTCDDLIAYLRQLHLVLPDPQRVYDVNAVVSQYEGKEDEDKEDEGREYEGREYESKEYEGNEYEKSDQQRALPQSVYTAPCHNDLNPWNIIVSPSGWVTLDWEFVGQNDPLFDLVALQQGLARPEHELPALAHALAGDKPDLIERLNSAYLQFWRREKSWAQYQIRAGNDRMEIRAQVEDAQQKLSDFAPFQSP